MADSSVSRLLGTAKESKWTDTLAQAVLTGFLFLVFVRSNRLRREILRRKRKLMASGEHMKMPPGDLKIP